MTTTECGRYRTADGERELVLLAAADGTFAYCGRYEIDAKNNRLVHLPEVATGRAFEGSRQIRPYKFEDGRLVLSDVETQEPGVVRWKIVWEKAR